MPAPPVMPLQQSFESGPGVAQQVAEAVSAFATRAGLPGRKAYWLRLAADELTTNIAHHGYSGGSGPVSLDCGLDAGTVWVTITDEAPEFDPRRHDPAPRLAAGPGADQRGGYGLLLAMINLDGFDYERAGGRNRSTLRMTRPRPGSAGTEGGSHDRDTRPGGG